MTTQAPNYSIPIGRGEAVTGFRSAAPGTIDLPLLSNGPAADPSFRALPTSGLAGEALTKTDDTNVTLTLGGTPTTALLHATSLTLGWTGTLALSRLAQGTDGQLIVGQTGASPLYKTISGEVTFTAAGAAALSRTFSPTMTGNWTFNPTSGNALTATTATGTLAKGFVINQSSTTGVVTGDQNYNEILVVNDRANQTGRANGLHVQQITINGATGQRAAISGLAELAGTGTATGGDIIGTSGIAFAIAPNGGTNTGAGALGTLYGIEATGQAASGATNYSVVSGGELDAIINTGGSAAHRWGLSIAANGDLQGAQTDAAIETHDATSAGRFTNFILLRGTPLTTGGIVLGTDGTAATITTGIDLSAYTITGNLIQGPGNFVVKGSGTAIGIGTSSPGANLDIVESNAATYSAAATRNPRNRSINSNTTDNNTAEFALGTVDAGATTATAIRLVGIFTSHTANAVSADLAIVTKNAGTFGEVAKFTSNGKLTLINPTGGFGYGTGAGGTVTQLSSKATAVTLDKVTGAITTHNAALAAATVVSFVVNDSAVAATDHISASHESGGTLGAYTINARATGAGTAAIDIRNNTAGSLSEALVIRFTVIKSVNA